MVRAAEGIGGSKVVAATCSSQKLAGKSRAKGPAKLRSDIDASEPSRGNGRHGSAGRKKSSAALESAAAHIARIAPLCNAARLMQGMRVRHDVDLTKAADGI
jgi:hypothetical protein